MAVDETITTDLDAIEEALTARVQRQAMASAARAKVVQDLLAPVTAEAAGVARQVRDLEQEHRARLEILLHRVREWPDPDERVARHREKLVAKITTLLGQFGKATECDALIARVRDLTGEDLARDDPFEHGVFEKEIRETFYNRLGGTARGILHALEEIDRICEDLRLAANRARPGEPPPR